MKTLFIFCGLFCLAILVGCQCVPKGKPYPVVCKPGEIDIPGTKFCPDDEKAVRSILSGYDKKLFRVERRENGVIKEFFGLLPEPRSVSGRAGDTTGQTVTAITSWTTRVRATSGNRSWVTRKAPGRNEDFQKLKDILCKYGEGERAAPPAGS